MLPPPVSPESSVADARLEAFLRAGCTADADRALAGLMDHALPLIRQSLGRGVSRTDEVEECVSEARTQLALRLQRLRGANGAGEPIADFDAYVAAVARTARAHQVRCRHPARAMLLNRLRYLLENRTNQRGFALWKTPGGETWAGFAAWRDRPVAADQAKLNRLLADPGALAREIFGPDGAEKSAGLADVVSSLFTWLGSPLPLRDLTDAVAEWQGIRAGRGEALVLDADDEEAAGSPAARAPSPHDALRWKEYLLWLLGEVARLTLRQRTAFLLHTSCLREMELLGLTGIRHTAALLEMPPERLAVHWASLPVEDRVIGTILGLEAQQVINLRKVARGILGRAWQSFLQEN